MLVSTAEDNMTGAKTLSSLFVSLLAALAATGCAGSAFKYTKGAYEENTPVKYTGCNDAAVLLGVGTAETEEIARVAVVGVDATITESDDTHLYANRKEVRESDYSFNAAALFVPFQPLVSKKVTGGEKLAVEWKRVEGKKTFVTVVTSFGGFACHIVDRMVSLAGVVTRTPKEQDELREPEALKEQEEVKKREAEFEEWKKAQQKNRKE